MTPKDDFQFSVSLAGGGSSRELSVCVLRPSISPFLKSSMFKMAYIGVVMQVPWHWNNDGKPRMISSRICSLQFYCAALYCQMEVPRDDLPESLVAEGRHIFHNQLLSRHFVCFVVHRELQRIFFR